MAAQTYGEWIKWWYTSENCPPERQDVWNAAIKSLEGVRERAPNNARDETAPIRCVSCIHHGSDECLVCEDFSQFMARRSAIA